MIVASILGDIFRPLFDLLAGIVTFWYAIIPSYGIAIALLTVTVMVALSPLTIRSTRSMLQLQAIQPKLKELQRQYGKDRAALAEAQQQLFKEEGVSPLGGCLPMVLQFPLLFVMYDVIRGLTHTVTTKHGVVAAPLYILHSSRLYKNLVADHGHMDFLGINLALTPLHLHIGFIHALPYYALVLIAVGLQYFQIQQISSKNPTAAAASRQALLLQQSTTVVFGIIYLDVPAGVALYFLVSGLFRVVQQELMWRHDPVLRAHSVEARRKVAEQRAADGRPPARGLRGLRELVSPPKAVEGGSDEAPPQGPRQGASTPQQRRQGNYRRRRNRRRR
jgi:YidC/Oxa1 family membrane protein insertase